MLADTATDKAQQCKQVIDKLAGQSYSLAYIEMDC